MIYKHSDITKNIDETCDVCVVGSGAGGAPAAKELAEAGLSVIMVEEGGYYITEDFQNTDLVDSMCKLFRDGGSSVVFGKPNIAIAEGRCVGGSTTVNGGMCWRTPEKILKRWQWEKGLTDLTPKKMDYFFNRVEDIISAKPIIPEARNEDSELLRRGAEKLGYRVRANIRAHRTCVGTNQCITGCPTGGKQSTLVSYIPAFIKAGGQLYANCRIKKVKIKGGRAAGVVGHIIDPDTKEKKFKVRIRAKVVIVAGGAIQTPSLLMRSRLPDTSQTLGRNLILHPNTKVVGVFDDPVYGWKGVNQGYQITEFFDEGIIFGVNFVPPGLMSLAIPSYGKEFLHAMKEIYNNCVVGAALIEDTSRGRVKNLPFDYALSTYTLNQQDFSKCLRACALMAEIYFAAGAKKVYLPLEQLHEIHTIDEIRKIYDYPFRPEDLELMTVHIMGTCQMGSDPKQSVINPFGESHHVKGLFVADASIFPTSIGVNPQETIMALSTRTALHIAENASAYLT